MIFLIILGIILLLLFLVLFLPVEIFIAFREEFTLKIKFLKIKLFEIEPKAEEKTSKSVDTVSDKKAKKETDSSVKILFSKLKEKYGFIGAVKEVMRFLLDCLTHIKWLLRYIKLKKLCLDLTVASSDAAKTAIDYGRACSAVYPVLALIDTIPNISFKEINVKSDFNSEKCEFGFSALVKFKIFFTLIAAFKIYKEYKNFSIRNECNERK